MSVSTDIRDHLLEHCFDLDLLAQKLGRDPEVFKKSLNGEYEYGDERNIDADEIAQLCEITRLSPTEILGF